MSRSSTSQIVLLLVLLIYLRGNSGSSSGVREPKTRCKEAERQALLKIKENLYVSSSDGEVDVLLSSWGKEKQKRECCEWIGVRCDNNSDHVISLDLSPSTFDGNDYTFLEGNISSSLIDLQYINYLDLSRIKFRENSIPSFIGTFSKLWYLNLSQTSLIGEIPPQLGNLSSLRFLDLSGNDVLDTKNLGYLVSNLSSLRQLDLSDTNMSSAYDWVHMVNNLPHHLTNLQLHGCNLPDIVNQSSLSVVNSSKVLAVLDLSWNQLSASIFQWLFHYNHSLAYLDLSANNFEGPIPNNFKNMAALTYLDLQLNQFQGFIPESFGNMIALKYLDLSSNQLDGYHPKSFMNMTGLKYIDLSGNFQFKGSIPESFGNMIGLTHLHLRGNRLDGLLPESFGNLTALTVLDLAYNQLEGSIPSSLGNMTSLEYLDLSNNMLEGEIPTSMWKICTLRELRANKNTLSGELQFAESSSESCANFSLEYLDLSHNRFTGSLPDFTLYPSLKQLLLFSNQFSGNVSESIGQLSQLETLYIFENSIRDVMTEAHFSKLFNLSDLDLSSNSDIALDIPADWIPPFQLKSILLSSCKLGPHFPKWLQTQKKYVELNISSTGISDSIPDWFWNHFTQLDVLDLSNNEIKGKLDGKQIANPPFGRLIEPHIDLSSNQLEGSIPLFLLQVGALNLSNNRFSELNSQLCNVTEYMPLTFLDVSYNQLSGALLDCWTNMDQLKILILSKNKLTGNIPFSIGFLTSIEILHLGNNNLSGQLPSSMKNCTELMVFDIAENKLSGPMPTWIGTSLTNLVILSLRSNEFNGSMPSELCQLVHLQVLDLSSNNLSSKIPKCLGNITAMREVGGQYEVIENPYGDGRFSRLFPRGFYEDKLFLVWKGATYEIKNQGLLKNIDLSSNTLEGGIPKEITELVGLISLNLSSNNLSGQIPKEIGQLRYLDALDLSKNHLHGQIPPSLAQVDRLNTLDLSSNNLSGKIPTSTQLQTRDAAAFMGNPQLCGDPLPKRCADEEEPTVSYGATEDGKKDEFTTKGFYVSVALGFVVGFWGVCGTLIFNKSWRYAYFKTLSNAGDWIYATAAVHKGKLLRMIKS